ncbi:hypothetical protein AGDE_11513 [Angomonas deanei]|nr:hypothetical protein AGDE_11513 [Angomonas deanei]|eukprot:EPY26155.1 hypothetical protein AGDE_11513 [Angomonas deanei]
MPPKKKHQKTKVDDTTPVIKTKRGLDEFYSEVYGERWPTLREALQRDTYKVAVYNRYCTLPKSEVLDGLVPFTGGGATSTSTAPQEVSYERQQTATGLEFYVPARGKILPKPPLDEFLIKGYYIMDYASAVVVQQLQLTSSDSVLDMCAAPGGKTVCIAQYLSNYNNMNLLTANEFARERFLRLKRTLREYIPTRNNYNNPHYLNTVHYDMSMRDGQTLFAPDKYNKILVDAPCSSERHLITQNDREGNSTEYKKFNEQTSLEIATTQKALLLRAFENVKEGGLVVYSTCSLSPYENDDLVKECQRVTRAEMKIVTDENHPCSLGEPTPVGGRLILPDVSDNWGPMYFCTFQKVGVKKSFSQTVEDSDDDLFKHYDDDSEEEEDTE